MKAKYEWKALGGPYNPVGDAQEIGEYLEDLSGQHGGGLTAREIVEDARRQSSPLHPNFEWDDEEAAIKYRDIQAGYLLRSIVVVQIDDKPIARPVRAFVHVKDGSTKEYRPTVVAFTRQDMARSVVEEALSEYKRWYRTYCDYKEFSEIMETLQQEGLLLAA